MKQIGRHLIVFFSLLLLLGTAAQAQVFNSSDSAFKEGTAGTGRIWGYAFGDYYTKTHSDALNRGGANQYTGVPKNQNGFAIRRLYLGYDYNISKRFSAELLMAAEGNVYHSPEDTKANDKLSFFVKYINLRIKDIWKGTDLVIGQSVTPSFSRSSEKLWGYRSIERTIADIRRTPSYDLGVSLQGKFDKNANYGYNLMVGNGKGAAIEDDPYKWFYGDIWAKFFDKKLTIDLYGDYQRLNWVPGWHHDRNMLKAFVGYEEQRFALGVEGFYNHASKDIQASNGAIVDTLDGEALGLSIFGHVTLMHEKLNAFARVDFFNPDKNYNNDKYTAYQGFSKNYSPDTKEKFITAGLDYTPIDRVHIMPNVWYNHYEGQKTGLTGSAKSDYDLVYRLTFYYRFGK